MRAEILKFIDLVFENTRARIVDAIESKFSKLTGATYYSCIGGLYATWNGQADPKSTLKRFIDLAERPPEDPDLHALFLINAIQAALNIGEMRSARQLLARLNLLDFDGMLPCIRAAALNTEGVVRGFTHATSELLDIYERARGLDLRPGKRPWLDVYANLVVLYANRRDFSGSFGALEELAQYKTELAQISGRSYDELHRMVCFACGKLGEALEANPQTSVSELPEHWRVLLLFHKGIAHLHLGDARSARKVAGELEELYVAKSYPPVVMKLTFEYLSLLKLVTALAKKDYPGARRVAREFFDSFPDMTNLRILMYMAEVELADKNAVAARRLLETQDKNEAEPRLWVHWARLYRLEGDREKAATFFRRALGVGYPEYIECQLRFAHELSLGDAIDLTTAAREKRGAGSVGKKTGASGRGGAEIEFVGASAAAARVRADIGQYAGMDHPVLIAGPTGTGKEIVARLLHEKSPRAAHDFIAVNCGSFSESLITAELFGYKKGAFTGAARDHDGILAAAGQGTVLLDEINSASPGLQAALLRAIETRAIRPVGGTHETPFGARLIFATNVPLAGLIAQKEFRSDLYYRINRFVIEIPPLAERSDDIPALTKYFVERAFGTGAMETTDDFIERLRSHSWPGNVRELENVVERTVLLAGRERVLDAAMLDLPAQAVRPAQTRPRDAEQKRMPLVPGTRTACCRRRMLIEYTEENGRITRAEACTLLGCAPNTATADLKALCDAGHLIRIETSGNLKTSYFVPA